MTYRSPVPVSEQLRIDAILCKAFDKQPGETLNDAAARALSASTSTIRVKWAARTLLRVTGPARDPWEAMAAAARILEGVHS